jgi:hypothetical protein
LASSDEDIAVFAFQPPARAQLWMRQQGGKPSLELAGLASQPRLT